MNQPVNGLAQSFEQSWIWGPSSSIMANPSVGLTDSAPLMLVLACSIDVHDQVRDMIELRHMGVRHFVILDGSIAIDGSHLANECTIILIVL